MADNWKSAYFKLQEFITKYPEIEIGTSAVSIPEAIRPEFYQLFDAVRISFFEEEFSGLLSEARILSEEYTKVEEDVIALIGLEGVTLPTILDKFLHKPDIALTQGLFGLLFDLLKKNITVEIFKQNALRNIEESFEILYPKGYEKWVLLSLIELLEVDKMFAIPLQHLGPAGDIKTMRFIPNEPVPSPKESKRLSFEHEEEPLFTVPDFILHSARLNKYVSARSEFKDALGTVSDIGNIREWYPFRSIQRIYGSAVAKPDLILYVDDSPDKLALIADASKIYRPDLILECRGLRGWYEKDRHEQIKHNFKSLQPKLGTYVISRDIVPESVLNELKPETVSKAHTSTETSTCPVTEQQTESLADSPIQQASIHVLVNDFDQSMFQPVIDALMQLKKEEAHSMINSQKAGGSKDILMRIYNAIFKPGNNRQYK